MSPRRALLAFVMLLTVLLPALQANALTVTTRSGTTVSKTVSKQEPYPQEAPTIKQADIITYSAYKKGDTPDTALALGTLRVNSPALIQQKGQVQNKQGLPKLLDYIAGKSDLASNPKSFGDIPDAFSRFGQVFDDMISYRAVPVGMLPDFSYPGLKDVKAFYAFVDSEYGLGYVNIYIFGKRDDQIVQISGTTGYQHEPARTQCAKSFEFKHPDQRDSCYFNALRKDAQLLPVVTQKANDLKTLFILQ